MSITVSASDLGSKGVVQNDRSHWTGNLFSHGKLCLRLWAFPLGSKGNQLKLVKE